MTSFPWCTSLGVRRLGMGYVSCAGPAWTCAADRLDSTVTSSFTLNRSRPAMIYMCLHSEWVREKNRHVQLFTVLTRPTTRGVDKTVYNIFWGFVSELMWCCGRRRV